MGCAVCRPKTLGRPQSPSQQPGKKYKKKKDEEEDLAEEIGIDVADEADEDEQLRQLQECHILESLIKPDRPESVASDTTPKQRSIGHHSAGSASSKGSFRKRKEGVSPLPSPRGRRGSEPVSPRAGSQRRESAPGSPRSWFTGGSPCSSKCSPRGRVPSIGDMGNGRCDTRSWGESRDVTGENKESPLARLMSLPQDMKKQLSHMTPITAGSGLGPQPDTDSPGGSPNNASFSGNEEEGFRIPVMVGSAPLLQPRPSTGQRRVAGQRMSCSSVGSASSQGSESPRAKMRLRLKNTDDSKKITASAPPDYDSGKEHGLPDHWTKKGSLVKIDVDAEKLTKLCKKWKIVNLGKTGPGWATENLDDQWIVEKTEMTEEGMKIRVQVKDAEHVMPGDPHYKGMWLPRVALRPAMLPPMNQQRSPRNSPRRQSASPARVSPRGTNQGPSAGGRRVTVS